MTTTAESDYSLGVDDAERLRLLAQCARHRPEAELLVDRIGVGPGWRTLDLGCGPLGVLDVLAGRVGPAGRVVGADREPTYLAMATRTLAERDVRGVELVEADATATGLPDAGFDLVHERTRDELLPLSVCTNMPPEEICGWIAANQLLASTPPAFLVGSVAHLRTHLDAYAVAGTDRLLLKIADVTDLDAVRELGALIHPDGRPHRGEASSA